MPSKNSQIDLQHIDQYRVLRAKYGPQPFRLHLGCGGKWIPGFVHIDLEAQPHVDIVGSVEHLTLFPDESVGFIYSSHTLEHFGRFVYEKVLGEWFRVLQHDGVLRLAVPDFAACANLYYEQGLEDGLSGLVGLVCGGQRNRLDYHKMIFDELSLTQTLLKIGFSKVRRWDWQQTEHKTVDDYSQAYLPHMDKKRGCLMSLNLEAVK